MEIPFVGKRADMLNKKALVAYFKGSADDQQQAGEFWSKAINSSNQHFYSCFNMGMKSFWNGEVSGGQLRADFSDDVFEHSTKGPIVQAMLLIATGHRLDGSKMLDEYIAQLDE